MEIEVLRTFQEEIKLLCEMNECHDIPVYIFLHYDERVVVRKGFSLSDAVGCRNFVVLNTRDSSNLGYVNIDGVYLGMYSNTLKCIEEIELNSDCRLLNITFSCGRGSYNSLKPSLVIRIGNGEERVITLDKCSVWAKDFPELFKMAYSRED